jgi:conserved hypothetical protein TIGR00051
MNNSQPLYIRHRYPIRIRYADTDKMGFAYNGNYLKYFEIGRTELMRHFDLIYSELEKAGYQLPLLEAHAYYHKAAFYDDLINIEAALDLNKIGPKIVFEYKLFRENELIAEGSTVHLFMKSDTKKACRPPKFFLDKINLVKNSLLSK